MKRALGLVKSVVVTASVAVPASVVVLLSTVAFSSLIGLPTANAAVKNEGAVCRQVLGS
jgi:hypothetical protein